MGRVSGVPKKGVPKKKSKTLNVVAPEWRMGGEPMPFQKKYQNLEFWGRKVGRVSGVPETTPKCLHDFWNDKVGCVPGVPKKKKTPDFTPPKRQIL